ncbi:hypothetical protein ANO11243_042200 [Dothideomycetidae sp. 11243]|nr:hypothetical protein ANO11243_042200 [fungal sp. No.11243]
MTPFGQQQMLNSGIKFFARYQALAEHDNPFVRASGSSRVIMAAQNFTHGFYRAKSKGLDKKEPYPILILSEAKGQNNTLAHGACPAFEKRPFFGVHLYNKWAAQFTPSIKQRLNKDLGSKLMSRNIVALMDLCGLATVAHPKGEVSRVCNLFPREEWKNYNHYYTLSKYYDHGAGHPLGPSQGIGWTNELIARLTGSPVNVLGSVNSTLAFDKTTFPLNRKLYADFTHDNDMVAILYAMGLYDTDVPEMANGNLNGYNAATASSFASRMYVEKMNCSVNGRAKTPELVRVLVNDRVVPLRNCGVDRFGRCTVEKFVKSLSFARSGGNWGDCWSKPPKYPGRPPLHRSPKRRLGTFDAGANITGVQANLTDGMRLTTRFASEQSVRPVGECFCEPYKEGEGNQGVTEGDAIGAARPWQQD